jgi:integrase
MAFFKIIMQHYQRFKKFKLDFFNYGESVVSKMKREGRVSTSNTYRAVINSLKQFTNSNRLDINEITPIFLEEYIEYLRNKGQMEQKYLYIAKAIFNLAREQFNDEEQGIIKIRHNPFKKIKIKSISRKPRQALTVKEIQQIIELQCKNKKHILAKDVFLLSFCLLGMNSADLYLCERVKDRRIIYHRRKTVSRRGDNSQISVLVPKQIKPIYEKYRDKSGKRVFNFYQQYSTFQGFNKCINKFLKSVGREINNPGMIFYAARRSWATIAYNTAGISKDIIHDALNHSNPHMKITDLYIDRDSVPIDKANRKVLCLFNFDYPAFPPSPAQKIKNG